MRCSAASPPASPTRCRRSTGWHLMSPASRRAPSSGSEPGPSGSEPGPSGSEALRSPGPVVAQVCRRGPVRLRGVRIVHVSDCYAPRVGGIETQVAGLAGAQAGRGHAVHVLTATAGAAGGPGRYRETVDETAGVRVHRMASPVTFGVPVHPRGRALIAKALRLLRPDLVHVHAGVVSPFAYDGARAARSAGLPLDITWHCMLDGVEPAWSVGSRLLRWRDAPLAASAVSSVAAERVGEALGRADVAVVPNGLDLEPWREAARRPTERTGPLRVIATQRLAPRKRAVPLVRLVAAAHEQLGRAGGGPAEEEVRRGSADGDLEAVAMGRVRREMLPTLYRDQDVFVSPARLEAFGLAALEARAAGLAVVAQRGTGVEEFVTHEREGLLGSDDAQLTAALVRLARDPDLLDRIRAHNRAQAPPMSWPEVIGRAEELYVRARGLVG